MKKWIYLWLLIATPNLFAQENSRLLQLEGEWKFRIDSLDVGITEKWYQEDLEGSVKLPGSMAENGLGDEVSIHTSWTGSIVDQSYFKEERYEKYRQPDNVKIPFWLKPVKYYAGPAWYQKEVNIPENWSGNRIFLHLERCHWESRIYVNNQEVGSQNSLSVPHKFELTAYLQPGDNRLSIRMDNRMIVEVGENSHSISDHTQSNWNGITGQLYLESKPMLLIKHVEIHPDIHSGMARVFIQLDQESDNDYRGQLSISAQSFNSERVHTPDTLIADVLVTEDLSSLEFQFPMGKEALLWDEFSPALYRMEVKLSDSNGAAIDQKSEVFGMREFSARGTRFQVNGTPIFLRGTLECCIFPLTGYPPSEEGYWEHLMKRCREHGLNHIRFHSWCPPEAAFSVADRLGIYLQVECGSWANQGSTIGDGKPVDQYIIDEADRIMNAYGNHPSFCLMTHGNEPAGSNQNNYLIALMESWRAKDKRRLYTAGAGWPLLPESDFHNGPQARIQQWGAELNSRINAEPPQTRYDFEEVISKYQIPFVSHEIGQWCVYPDFKEIDKYTGVLRATNFEIFQETLEENHMGDQSEEFLMASGKLQALCYKAEIEAALRTPGFAGFQLLQLHDFPGQGTALVGVLDPFFNSKGYISPEQFRQFCEETVPLARMEKQVFENHETFRAEIELSHFAAQPLKNATLLCRILNSHGELLHQTKLEKEEIPIDNAIPLGVVEYDLQNVESAEKLILSVEVEGTPFKNSWEIWVYPSVVEPQAGNVYLTDKLDNEARKKLKEGASVLLLTHGQVNKDHGAEVGIGFSSIFWNTMWTRGQAPHTLGILCNPDHAVFKGFPTEYHSNWQWWDPVSHSQAMIMDDLPAELRPLIQAIDTWFENRRLGLMFEARVGPGQLMVCSINLQDQLSNRPVSRQLLNSILNYMNSPAFNPDFEVELDRIAEII